MIQSYFRNCQGAVLVFDLGRKETTAGLPEIVDDFRNKCPEMAQNNIVLIGNKLDQENRDVSTQEGKFLAQQLGCHSYFECSAKENIFVDQAFFSVAKKAYEID